MVTVQYGEWKITVDLEKTKEYYSNYVINDTQANRNFSEYCKKLSKDEKDFFDSLGITPECCEIEHIGATKKKDFPCGGFYIICGSYLEYPKEELLTVEEVAENGFGDNRNDPRISIGIFEFNFQCEQHVFCILPENMPEGFICVRFWCEDMKWLLPEKPEVMMYEPPKFWEIGRIIRERKEAATLQKTYLNEEKDFFRNRFEQLGIEYTELSPKEVQKYKQKMGQWLFA